MFVIVKQTEDERVCVCNNLVDAKSFVEEDIKSEIKERNWTEEDDLLDDCGYHYNIYDTEKSNVPIYSISIGDAIEEVHHLEVKINW